MGKVVASRARRVVRDVTSSLASMSLASRIDGIDAKLSHEFAAAFGDAVCDELEREGDEALASRLRRILHCADAETATEVADEMYGDLKRTGTWATPSHRECYVLAELRRCVGLLREGGGEAARRAMKAVDMAFIVGAPGDALAEFVQTTELALDVETTRRRAYVKSEVGSGWLFPQSPPQPTVADDRRFIGRVDGRLSRKEFKTAYYNTDTPVVLVGLGAEWPAMTKWDDLRWWRDRHGHRSVPLELGKYHDNTWREDVKTLAEFIDEHMVPSISGRAPGDDVAYLAQHQLVDQLSDLSSDFVPPEYCQKSLERINVWMGTAGTITPCHFDTYDNLLGQARLIDLALDARIPGV